MSDIKWLGINGWLNDWHYVAVGINDWLNDYVTLNDSVLMVD
jgi:hypothetical protein